MSDRSGVTGGWTPTTTRPARPGSPSAPEPPPTRELPAPADATTAPISAVPSTADGTWSWSWKDLGYALKDRPGRPDDPGDASPRSQSSPTMPERPTLRLDGFEVLDELGRGGMGIVYRARKLSLDSIVALKVLPPAFSGEAAHLERFLNEARIAARLDDAHLVPVMDLCWADGLPVLVMPYIDGGDLNRLLRARKLVLRHEPPRHLHPWAVLPAREFQAQVLGLLDQLVEAVARLHEAEILHRDIKPSNCLLDARGHLRLSDFGLARLADSVRLTRTGGQLGTPGYMSPEAWEGRTLDARSDVFALGATLFHALALELPYGRERINADATLPRRTLGRMAGVPPELEQVVLKAIEPEPERRYPDALRLREDWQRVRGGLPPKYARPPSLWRRVPGRVRRRVLFTGLLLALLSFGGFGLWSWMFPPPPPGPDDPVPVRLGTGRPFDRFAFIPLDEDTGEPQPDSPHARRGRGAGSSQLDARLRPGLYLLVLTWPDAPHHEVYRRVPRPTEVPDSIFYAFTREGDRVVLSGVAPPAPDVARSMVPIAGTEAAPRWVDEQSGHRAGGGRVAPFLLDPREFSVADLQAVRRASGTTPPGLPRGMLGPDGRPMEFEDAHPIENIEWEEAAHYLELCGKRLPRLEEYIHAVGGDPTPAGWVAEGDERGWPIRSVDDPRIDRLPADPRLVGLRSNVGEWTATWAASGRTWAGQAPAEIRGLRVVFGAPDEAITGLPGPGRDYGLQARVPLRARGHWQRDPRRRFHIGFRGARSAAPPYLDPPAPAAP